MVKNPRGGLKPGEATFDKTDFSFADSWLPERKFPQYIRIQVKYPLVEDRSAPGNIQYEDELEHRTFGGKVPKEDLDYNNLTIRPPLSLNSAKYVYISPVSNISHVPKGYYGTSSGIFPIDFEPFTVGDTTDHPTQVDDKFTNSGTSAEFLYAKNIESSNNRGQRYPYIPNDPSSQGIMFNWEISPSFDNPTEPAVRFPNGAIRRPYFK